MNTISILPSFRASEMPSEEKSIKSSYILIAGSVKPTYSICMDERENLIVMSRDIKRSVDRRVVTRLRRPIIVESELSRSLWTRRAAHDGAQTAALKRSARGRR
jgi:hypothetical protein